MILVWLKLNYLPLPVSTLELLLATASVVMLFGAVATQSKVVWADAPIIDDFPKEMDHIPFGWHEDHNCDGIARKRQQHRAQKEDEEEEYVSHSNSRMNLIDQMKDQIRNQKAILFQVIL